MPFSIEKAARMASLKPFQNAEPLQDAPEPAAAVLHANPNGQLIACSENLQNFGISSTDHIGCHWQTIFDGYSRQEIADDGSSRRFILTHSDPGRPSLCGTIHNAIGPRPGEIFILIQPGGSPASLAEFQKTHTLGLLAGEVAHELNNTLTSISGWLQLLAQELPDGHPQRESIEMLHSETRRSARTAADLLAMARGRGPRPFEPVDLAAVLETVLELTAPSRKDRNITVSRPSAAVPKVYGCEDQLKQVFLNLMINAANAIEDEGRITLAAGADGESVRVVVSDTGIGIPPENLPRIFEPFFSTRTEKGGTGLGLHVCRQIIHRHNGELLVESMPGCGSAFTVLLPAARGEAPP